MTVYHAVELIMIYINQMPLKSCHLSEITELKYTSLIKISEKRKSQMALRGFCI